MSSLRGPILPLLLFSASLRLRIPYNQDDSNRNIFNLKKISNVHIENVYRTVIKLIVSIVKQVAIATVVLLLFMLLLLLLWKWFITRMSHGEQR